ncbi:MAG: patatin family protein [Moraxellaceae bacterium]|nr:MAG: patatin family protein [Moraxellaceae bacterium]
MKRELKACLSAMAVADSYQAWSDAAKEYDQLSGNDEWKDDDASPHYDYKMIRLRYNELRTARERGDVNQLVFFFNEGLHGNLGGIANPLLYQSSLFGTKHLVTDYLDEVCACLRWISNTEFSNFSFVQKLEFFERTSQAFGQSALMLSGGAALGLFHLGVLKAMFDEDLLPSVISGSSAGSIMAAVLATHSDEELHQIFDPEYLFVEAFRAIGWRGTLKGQGVLDPAQLEVCLERNVKDMTFEEAFKHSGRKVNITVSPADPHQESRLLNALSSPHVLIRKATLASCSIPYIYPPVMLWAKNIDGEKCPFIPSRQWVDGSIKDDLPAQRLARLYGVNHTIVSQTNPHVAPFVSRVIKEKNLAGYVTDMAINNVRNNVSQGLKYLTDKATNLQLALLLDKAHSVVDQSYMGDVNIVPPRRAMNIFKVLTNATPSILEEFIKEGAAAVYPKIESIRNSTMISRTINECLDQLKLEEERELKEYSMSHATA